MVVANTSPKLKFRPSSFDFEPHKNDVEIQRMRTSAGDACTSPAVHDAQWGRGGRRRDRVLCVGAVMVGTTVP